MRSEAHEWPLLVENLLVSSSLKRKERLEPSRDAAGVTNLSSEMRAPPVHRHCQSLAGSQDHRRIRGTYRPAFGSIHPLVQTSKSQRSWVSAQSLPLSGHLHNFGTGMDQASISTPGRWGVLGSPQSYRAVGASLETLNQIVEMYGYPNQASVQSSFPTASSGRQASARLRWKGEDSCL